jgi:hypothetical protein
VELSIPYQLIGPDGTRIVVGNGSGATDDVDWVGYINPDQGISGLDGAEVRESADNLVEADGGIHGSFYEGRRSVVLNFDLDPGRYGPDTAALERRVKRASRALREDALLRWTPSDIGLELELRLRRQGRVSITGRHPKQVQIPMVAEDPIKRTSSEAQQTLTPDTSAGVLGFTSPITSPIETELAPTGQALVENQGDVEAIPRFKITGPITNPELINSTTEQRIKLLYTLGAGEELFIDAGRKTVLLGGTADRFGAVVYPDSKWWRLQPGSNDVRLLAAAYSAGAELVVYWRHAYE